MCVVPLSATFSLAHVYIGHNIGYKHNDPSHPCRKCWVKYAKPFSGALAYTPFNSATQAAGSKTFQRPLPVFRPPQQQLHQPHNHYGPPPPPQQMRSYPPPRPQIQHISSYAPMPRGAVVYRPGDPRIGGRLCWRCDGNGTVSYMLFDETTCGDCGGCGRVFV